MLILQNSHSHPFTKTMACVDFMHISSKKYLMKTGKKL